MIDIHCHILPGIDDGPSDIGESVEMARIAAEDGITTIVATPHVGDGGTPVTSIRERVDVLNGRLADLGIPLTVLRGADVSSLLEPSRMSDYTIEGTGYLLVEFPHSRLPMNAGQLLFDLAGRGLRAIVTHPERNPSVIRNPRVLFDLMEAGPLVQITAGSLTGDFGIDVRECALHLLKKGAVSFIATDAHSTQWRRPVLSEGLGVAERVVGRKEALRLVTSNPEAVIRGHDLHGP